MNHIKCALLGTLLCCGATVLRAEDAPLIKPDAGLDMKKANDEYSAHNYGYARDLYLKIAESGNSEAQAMLCVIYMGDNDIFPGSGRNLTIETTTVQEIVRKRAAEKYAEALKWCRKSAAQGDPKGETSLGRMYHLGLGVARDDHKAMELFMKAAQKNHSTAQYNMGIVYRRGYGVKKDYAEALKWFHKAAAQNYAPAMVGIGILYEDGLGVKKDPAGAVKWYRMAADKGSPTGEHNMARVYRYGIGVAKDENEAVKWYGKAAAHGNAYAKKYMRWKTANDMTKEVEDLHKAVDFGEP
ncbi:MAG: tetratricopeptide repeat protein [Elusimicrobia bacterium]|nr:tetratricopeptide repeat protein [Elusimicrobiota bacterium]